MKKMTLFLAFLMVIAQGYGFAYPTVVDNVIESKSKSELHPLQDAAKLTGIVNDGVNKAMKMEPIATAIKPIETVRKETVKGAYKVTNTLWDVLTFRWMKSKDKPKA